jgi:hypothetical protein
MPPLHGPTGVVALNAKTSEGSRRPVVHADGDSGRVFPHRRPEKIRDGRIESQDLRGVVESGVGN